MLNKMILILSSLLLTFSHALEASERHTCSDPAVASADLNRPFRYGCFCGEEYPNIAPKNYHDLNRSQRQLLIAKYRIISPYDDIDKLCQAHDICYIQEGRHAKSCDQKLYKDLNDLEAKFQAQATPTAQQCQNLVNDIGSVFNTIFAPSDDDDTPFDLGALMLNGAITASNKMLQESADTLSDANLSAYPPKGVKCLRPKTTSNPKTQTTTPILIRTIQR